MRRFALFATILGMLAFLDAIDDRLFTAVVSMAILISPSICTTAWLVLRWCSQQAPEIESLQSRERDAQNSTVISWSLAGAGAAGLLRVFGVQLPGRPVLILLAFGLVLIPLSALEWLDIWKDIWLPRLRR